MNRFFQLILGSTILLSTALSGMSVADDYSDIREYFDPGLYASENADVVNAFGSSPDALFQHYMNYGMYEGRRGSWALDPFRLAVDWNSPSYARDINSLCYGWSRAWYGWLRLGDYACIIKRSVRCAKYGACDGLGYYFYFSFLFGNVSASDSNGQWNEFSWQRYFSANPDVAQFCSSFYNGNYYLMRVCALKHYAEYGYHESPRRHQ